MKKVKRALALSGGGPVVGLEVGALKALEKHGIDFDVFSCGCVGSWAGCLYNSFPDNETKKIEKLTAFFEKIFVPDDIYSSFPVATGAFIVDYAEDFNKTMKKMFDPATYQNLFLPSRITEFMFQTWQNPPKTNDEVNLWISQASALNPLMRYMMELNYKLPKSGIAGLVKSTSFIESYIDFNQLLKSKKTVYLNAYNLTKQRIELFINRDNDPKYASITPRALMAGSSVLHYTENPEMNGDKYCEGAVVDTVNFKDLVENHPDLNEVWVIRITDYKTIKPPKNVIESELLGVMLPFDTIAADDVKLFKYHLKDRGLDKKIAVIDIEMKYQELTYDWNYSNLYKGIEAGYQGALKTIKKYQAETAE
ncbi:MAG TPA: hypothetical protein DHW82_07215 [Spirochaetia bacterium]|nr:hypothetical protein [Spirochaetia bacterium]